MEERLHRKKKKEDSFGLLSPCSASDGPTAGQAVTDYVHSDNKTLKPSTYISWPIFRMCCKHDISFSLIGDTNLKS